MLVVLIFEVADNRLDPLDERAPFLAGALLVGGTVAEGLAMGWGVPAIPVHHMEAHLLAAMLEGEGADERRRGR